MYHLKPFPITALNDWDPSPSMFCSTGTFFSLRCSHFSSSTSSLDLVSYSWMTSKCFIPGPIKGHFMLLTAHSWSNVNSLRNNLLPRTSSGSQKMKMSLFVGLPFVSAVNAGSAPHLPVLLKEQLPLHWVVLLDHTISACQEASVTCMSDCQWICYGAKVCLFHGMLVIILLVHDFICLLFPCKYF
jgi:hypothetical protein